MKPENVTVDDLIRLAEAKGLSIEFLAGEFGVSNVTRLGGLFTRLSAVGLDPSKIWDDVDNYITGGG